MISWMRKKCERLDPDVGVKMSDKQLEDLFGFILAMVDRAVDGQEFRRRVEAKVDTIKEGVDRMIQQVADFKTKVDAAFASVNTALDNIVTDETGLAKQIQDLKDIIAAGPITLDPASQAALDAVSASADALLARTKSIADSVPDTVTP